MSNEKKIRFWSPFLCKFWEAVGAVIISNERENVIGTNMLVKICAKT